MADDEARRGVLREDLRAVILALARDAEVSDAYVREGLGCLNRLRAVCGLDSASLFKLARRRRRAPRHRRAFVPAQPAATRPSSTPYCSGLMRSPRSTTRCCGPRLARRRRRHRSFSAQDWEDALEGQEPFAGGAAPAGDGPDTQSFDKTSEKGDDDGMDDFD